ncbi:hypothetical protein DMB44_05505 [Thermoplasma sp. Kam2015]|nr:hypothetical protein DMB44_05505 [Thermoplasma sp. Kam2015]
MVRILMRHAKFETTKEYIQESVEDAISSVRRIDLDFGPTEKIANPKDHERPGRASLSLTQPPAFAYKFYPEVAIWSLSF